MRRIRPILHLVSLLAALALLLGVPARAVETVLHVVAHAHVESPGLPDHDHRDVAGGHGAEPVHPADHPVDCSTCRELMLASPIAPWQADAPQCAATAEGRGDEARPDQVCATCVFAPAAPPTGPPRA